MKALTSWPVPLAMTLLFAALLWNSNASTAGILAAAVGLALVLLFWGMFREMSVHADVSRALSVGDAATARRLAEVQLARRKGAAKAPFWLYRAMAHELAGQWQECLDAVDEARPQELRRGGAASWKLVAACLRVGAWSELGEVARARALFDEQVAPRVAVVGDSGSLLAQLAEGRLRLAEGDLTGALARLTPLTRNIRLGPAQRAMAFHYLARASSKQGDATAAERAQAQATALVSGGAFARSPAAATTPAATTAPGA